MKFLFFFALTITILSSCTPAQVRPDNDDDSNGMREFRLNHFERAH